MEIIKPFCFTGHNPPKAAYFKSEVLEYLETLNPNSATVMVEYDSKWLKNPHIIILDDATLIEREEKLDSLNYMNLEDITRFNEMSIDDKVFNILGINKDLLGLKEDGKESL